MNPRIFTALIIVIIVGYGIIKALPLISGPHIIITSLSSGENSSDGFVTVSGTLIHAQNVSLDGNALITDERGNFSSIITLPAGNSVLSIQAQDRFGRSVTEQRIVYIP